MNYSGSGILYISSFPISIIQTQDLSSENQVVFTYSVKSITKSKYPSQIYSKGQTISSPFQKGMNT